MCCLGKVVGYGIFGVVKCIRKGCDEGWYGWIFNWGMVRVE